MPEFRIQITDDTRGDWQQANEAEADNLTFNIVGAIGDVIVKATAAAIPPTTKVGVHYLEGQGELNIALVDLQLDVVAPKYLWFMSYFPATIEGNHA